MSAFEYYGKNNITEKKVNLKSISKKKLKKMKFKMSKKEKVVEKPKKTSCVLNNFYSLNLKDSSKTGQKLMEWLIHPISIDDFMK
jgi:hypothetical protein